MRWTRERKRKRDKAPGFLHFSIFLSLSLSHPFIRSTTTSFTMTISPPPENAPRTRPNILVTGTPGRCLLESEDALDGSAETKLGRAPFPPSLCPSVCQAAVVKLKKSINQLQMTPLTGTGKTTTASLIADAAGFEHVDVGALVKKEVR